MFDADIADLYAYLQSQPIAQPNKRHEVKAPFGWRFLEVFWRALFFTPGPLAPVAGQSAEWNRGRYLAEAVVHGGAERRGSTGHRRVRQIDPAIHTERKARKLTRCCRSGGPAIITPL